MALSLASLSLTYPACQNDSPSSTTEKPLALSAPTVFVPVGILKLPRGIAVDASGNVWVADSRNFKLRKFSPAGNQVDSIMFVFPLSKIAIRKPPSGDLLVIENEYTVHEIIPETKFFLRSTTIAPNPGDASAAFDVNTGVRRSINASVTSLGDIAANPNGSEIYVSAKGTPENFIIRILSGNPSVIAYSSTVPSSSDDVGARLVAADNFGGIYTAFTFAGTSGRNVVRLYALNPINVQQSRIVTEPIVSGRASGAAIDASGILYIAEPATQELLIISTITGKTIVSYRIPDTNGFAMIPQAVSVASDGAVFVAVTDRNGTDAGAILKYTRASQ